MTEQFWWKRHAPRTYHLLFWAKQIKLWWSSRQMVQLWKVAGVCSMVQCLAALFSIQTLGAGCLAWDPWDTSESIQLWFPQLLGFISLGVQAALTRANFFRLWQQQPQLQPPPPPPPPPNSFGRKDLTYQLPWTMGVHCPSPVRPSWSSAREMWGCLRLPLNRASPPAITIGWTPPLGLYSRQRDGITLDVQSSEKQ